MKSLLMLTMFFLGQQAVGQSDDFEPYDPNVAEELDWSVLSSTSLPKGTLPKETTGFVVREKNGPRVISEESKKGVVKLLNVDLSGDELSNAELLRAFNETSTKEYDLVDKKDITKDSDTCLYSCRWNLFCFWTPIIYRPIYLPVYRVYRVITTRYYVYRYYRIYW